MIRIWNRLWVTILLASLMACVAPRQNEPWEAPQRSDAHVRLAMGYMQRGNLEIAIQELQEALKIQPNSVWANHVMATAQQRIQRFEIAEKYYRKATRLAPDDSGLLTDFGLLLCRQGKYDEAMTRFDRALEDPLNPFASLAYIRAGSCLMLKPDHARAEVYLRNALALEPGSPAALLHMANIKFSSGNFLNCRAYLERFFAVTDANAKSLLLAVKTESRLGSNLEANDYAVQLRRLFPGSDEAKELDNLQVN